ncbi:MAG: trehalose-6-phosphate synthase, partial [bacterium]|nr:trehalose-6-phosphate synthase [bacterium]
MRILIISNRLPVTALDNEGELTFQESAGGLVSGLNAYLDSLKNNHGTPCEYLWIGWPGIPTEEERRPFKNKFFAIFKFFSGWSKAYGKKEKIRSQMMDQFNSYPVFLSQDDIDKFYYGFSNRTLWPLFHYFPVYATYNEDYWNHYKKVNEIFCENVLRVLKPDDIVWIHDYQLMLLPGLLKEKRPDLSIGFFLHIPFPSFEIFRLLPREWRTGILQGLLGADLIGFHTHEYTQYFLRCVLRLMGIDHNLGEIFFLGRLVKADTFPMGIDFKKFYNARNSKEVLAEKNKLRETFKNHKIIFSVDRLDYTKGIINRLKGYERFLDKYPKYHNKIVLILVVVPS